MKPHPNTTRRCPRFPNKARYSTASFAWRVGARQIKKTGVALHLYRCACGGWHLSKERWADAHPIVTKSTPRIEVADECKESA